MDRNPITAGIARRVSRAIAVNGADVHTVAQAADITSQGLLDRLAGRVEFEISELVTVGGFLRVPATELLGGTACLRN